MSRTDFEQCSSSLSWMVIVVMSKNMSVASICCPKPQVGIREGTENKSWLMVSSGGRRDQISPHSRS